jgi:exopolysaccharide biosynthesis polyprenyl glycosylphosphotransferase
VTDPSPIHLTRLELRHRALALQRRRFWREFSYGAILVLADVLTLAIVFSILGMLPTDALGPSMGAGGLAFVRGLIPQTAIALGRRVTSLLFCLVVTGSYAHTERQAHPGRMAAALLLGLVLPRWVEIWQSALPARWLLLGFVLAASWVSLVLQRRALVDALHPIDPRRLERSRTLIVGPADDVRAVNGDDKTPTFVLSDSWPDGTAESMRELYSALGEWDADAIVLVGAVGDAALQAVMIAASSAGASVYATRRAAFRQLDEPSFVLRRAEPIAVLSRPALVGSQLVVKRFVDLAGAVVGLVALSPVLLVAAVAVRLTSRGPVFFRQVRVGLGGDPFVMMKFRTMVDDAEHQLAELQQANVYSTEPLFKMEKDPRMTPIGVFLRKSSLDELPQLLNVLRGEMSLVGPRPALPSEVRRYQQHHFVRFEVLPGITGPWQVSGRNAITSFEDVVHLESSYIRGWTVWRDLGILARTVPAVFSMKGAF